MPTIRVQTGSFDVGHEMADLTSGRVDIGGIGCFVGIVRGNANDDRLAALTLEHYPGMTERSLAAIADTAMTRWHLLGCTLIHRIGRLPPRRPHRSRSHRRRPSRTSP